MQTTIIYFTGTGNSLAVSNLLANRLPDTTVISVYKMLHQKTFSIDGDFCGFVFPVYCQNIPEILHRLVRKIEFSSSPYIFAVATHNGDPGYSHFTINKALKKKKQRLQAGFAVPMPGNCITPFNSSNPDDVVKRRLNALEAIVDKMSNSILKCAPLPYEGSASLRKRVKGLRNMFRFKVIYKVPEKFWSTDACDLCGICVKICPENNITIDSGSPIWGKHCQMCLACIHWCPKHAIQNRDGTLNIKRYHHPEISLNDMVIRNIDKSIVIE